MYVLKRDGRNEAVKFDKITARIQKMCYGLDDLVDPTAVAMKVIEGTGEIFGTELARGKEYTLRNQCLISYCFIFENLNIQQPNKVTKTKILVQITSTLLYLPGTGVG